MVLKPGQRIPEEILERPVSGVNLVPGSFVDQLVDDVHLLVFLRHFGCMFCRETLADLRALCEGEEPGFPAPLFFFEGSPLEGKVLLREHWAEARAIADPDAELYEAFGVGRGGLVKMFGPGVWAGRSRAAAKGHTNGARSGDVFRMPGAFLVRGDEVVWAHEYGHAADHPDWETIRALADEARRRAS